MSSFGMPHPLQMFHGNLSELSNKVKVGKKVQFGNKSHDLVMEAVTAYGHAPCRVTFWGGGLILFDKIPI